MSFKTFFISTIDIKKNMIVYLKGKIKDKAEKSVIIENNGIGYEVILCPHSLENISLNEEREIYISESFSMYEGTILYGFLSSDHKNIFELFRNSIPDTGSKKAMEYLNKALKSTTEFKKAILKNDIKLLTEIFGFRPKTAEKILSAVKDKIKDVFKEEKETSYDIIKYNDVLNALISLGYKTGTAKEVLEEISNEIDMKNSKTEEILKIALKKINK